MILVVRQDDLIEEALLEAIDMNPHKDKSEIYSIVEEELHVPRATIRRVKKQLLVRLQEYVEVLR